VAFFSYLKALQDKPGGELSRLCDVIISIVSTWLSSDRLSDSLLVFLERILGSGALRSILTDPTSTFASEIFRLIKMEVPKMREIAKLKSCTDVLCQLVQVSGNLH